MKAKLKNCFTKRVKFSYGNWEDGEADIFEVSINEILSPDFDHFKTDIHMKNLVANKDAERNEILSAIEDLENVVKILRKQYNPKEVGK